VTKQGTQIGAYSSTSRPLLLGQTHNATSRRHFVFQSGYRERPQLRAGVLGLGRMLYNTLRQLRRRSNESSLRPSLRPKSSGTRSHAGSSDAVIRRRRNGVLLAIRAGEAELKKAVELDPSDATAYQWLSEELGEIGGRAQEASTMATAHASSIRIRDHRSPTGSGLYLAASIDKHNRTLQQTHRRESYFR